MKKKRKYSEGLKYCSTVHGLPACCSLNLAAFLIRILGTLSCSLLLQAAAPTEMKLKNTWGRIYQMARWETDTSGQRKLRLISILLACSWGLPRRALLTLQLAYELVEVYLKFKFSTERSSRFHTSNRTQRGLVNMDWHRSGWAGPQPWSETEILFTER